MLNIENILKISKYLNLSKISKTSWIFRRLEKFEQFQENGSFSSQTTSHKTLLKILKWDVGEHIKVKVGKLRSKLWIKKTSSYYSGGVNIQRKNLHSSLSLAVTVRTVCWISSFSSTQREIQKYIDKQIDIQIDRQID